MDTKKVRLGSISILLSVVILCVTVLAVLSLTSARADALMAERFGDQTKSYYELQAEGQAFLAEADEMIRKGSFETAATNTEMDEDGNLVRVIEKDSMKLTIVLAKDDTSEAGYQVLSYRTEVLWEEDLTLDLLP